MAYGTARKSIRSLAYQPQRWGEIAAEWIVSYMTLSENECFFQLVTR